MGVDGVLDAVLALELTVLGDLTDEDDDAVVLLGPVGESLGAAEGRHRVGTAAFHSDVVVEGLERVLEDEDLLVGVGLAKHLRVLQEASDRGVLTDHEALTKSEAFHHHLHLEERLLTGVVEADVTSLGDAVRQLEEHRGLASAGSTSEHHHRRGDEAFATERVVKPGDADLAASAESPGDLDIVDGGTVLETANSDVEVHLRHVVFLVENLSLSLPP